MINEGRKVYDGPLTEIDPEKMGLDAVFAQLTGHDPVTGARLREAETAESTTE
jgi:hypothetical protein